MQAYANVPHAPADSNPYGRKDAPRLMIHWTGIRHMLSRHNDGPFSTIALRGTTTRAPTTTQEHRASNEDVIGVQCHPASKSTAGTNITCTSSLLPNRIVARSICIGNALTNGDAVWPVVGVQHERVRAVSGKVLRAIIGDLLLACDTGQLLV